MKTKWTTLFLFINLFSIFPMVAEAAPSQSTLCCPHRDQNTLVKKLHLSDAQITQIEKIRLDTTQIIQSDWIKLKSLQAKSRAAIYTQNFDEAKLDAVIKEKTDTIFHLMKTKALSRHQIFTILSPEQQKTFQTMVTGWDEVLLKKEPCDCKK